MMDEREYPKRKQMRLPAYDYAENGLYFITVCTRTRGQEVLCSVGDGLRAVPPGSVCLTELGQIVDQAIQKIPSRYKGVSVDTYCIMPDHIHLLVVLEAGRDRARPLPDIIGRMKSYTDWQYRLLGAPFGPKLWQRGYYDHVIRNQCDLRNTRQYILNNPRKWIQDKEP